MPTDGPNPDSPFRFQRPPALVALFVALGVVALVAYVRIGVERATLLPIAYGMPLLICLWFQSRHYLWILVAAFTAISAVHYARLPDKEVFIVNSRWAAFALVEIDTLVVAAVFHYLIGTRATIERRTTSLEERNRELASREETIAQQNEELQAKTEELERQGEELRVTNEELETRERMLEQLLELSHSLTAELTRGQLTARLCDAVASLLNVPGSAAALLERSDVAGELRVTACDGFTDGIHDDPIPLDASFAAIVMDRGQTAYVEDLRRRPDLVLPKPRTGEPMRSVLATPLRVHGKPVGTVEVYSPEPRNWSRKEIALLEALAAQASTSLENLHLFEEIEDQRRRLETIFRTLPVGVMISDASYSDVRLNAAGAAVVGESPDINLARADAIGGRWWLEQDGRALQHADQPIVRALQRGEEVRGQELEVVFHDGRRLTLLVAAAPITDRTRGRTLGAVCTFVDISPLKRLQRELEQRRQEAEEASVRKTRFLAAVSHDIRTPANAINLLAELLRRTAETPDLVGEIPQMAAELQASALSLVNLVSDVLDVTRYDYGKVDLHESEFVLADLVEEQLRQLRPLAQAKRLILEPPVIVPPGMRLRADRTKLGRVVANLLGNAIKFTEAGTVGVRAMLVPSSDRRDALAGGELRISVIDTGVGISPEHLPRIFDEFFQIKNPARDRTKGAGLGLAICKRLVEAMDGTLSVRSDPGVGATFTVTLPDSLVVAAPSTAVAEVTPPRPIIGPAGRQLAGLRVLLVEDHTPTRVAAAALLEAEGAAVTAAADGAQALWLLGIHHGGNGQSGGHVAYDVLLLDLMLPDIDGAEVLRRMGPNRPAKLGTVLVLTGDVTPERGEEILTLGADGLIHKPIDVQAIVRLLHDRAAMRDEPQSGEGSAAPSNTPPNPA